MGAISPLACRVLPSFEMPVSRTRTVPDIVIGRLPLYLRALDVMRAAGREVTSSRELAESLGVGSAQLRKDLTYFGEFGKQGTGYDISGLQAALRAILGIDREWPLIVIGAGHIGSAVANYPGFAERGFRVIGVFDADPAKVGAGLGDVVVRPMSELSDFVRARGVRHAMLAVPAERAQAVADAAVAAGICAILNYAPINLSVRAGVYVEYIDPALHLQRMTYYLG